jgi:aspartyl-tRNA(Asn)/glutamyl-tRNA(Gln) amidotransferase subunit A
MDADPCWLSATEMASGIAAGRLSPVELVDLHLQRISRLNPTVNAFITHLPDQAREEARRAEKAVAEGRAVRALHGVPFAVKDNIDTAGIRTTRGSWIHRDYVPPVDARLVRNLRRAGGILLGKAHLHEFAYGPDSANPHFGQCRNPWNLRRIPGGSSGGSAVAVAAGLVPIAIGTDTGGSIRLPAAFCGVVGMKPTYGRVSRHGIFPNSWTLDQAGPLARTVADIRRLLGVLTGAETASDPRPRPAGSGGAVSGSRWLAGVRVGLLKEHESLGLHREVASCLERSIRVLEWMGATVESVSAPLARATAEIYALIVSVETAVIHEPHLRESYGLYGADVRTRLIQGFGVPAVDYVRAQQARRALTRQLRATLSRVDAILSPTVAIPAPRIGAPSVTVGKETYSLGAILPRLTRLQNLTGHPAVTVPAGFTRDRLPIGMEFSGPPHDDERLLDIAEAFERAVDVHPRRPDL